MLISDKIKKVIEAEIKAQKNLLKLVNTQEKSYGQTYDKVKNDIEASITYYEKVLKDAA